MDNNDNNGNGNGNCNQNSNNNGDSNIDGNLSNDVYDNGGHKETLKSEAFALSCLHPSSKLCVKDTRGYTQAVGLWSHVLIMIRNPICPTLLAPKEMLPPYSCNQVSVGDGGDC